MCGARDGRWSGPDVSERSDHTGPKGFHPDTTVETRLNNEKAPTRGAFSHCERLQWMPAIASRYFSASSAAWQPVPALVIAWR
ncbi:MAG: hypothetical protein K0Q76_2927 [Panacagrimonas sp.]|nr:hypothetical protein [Panacagrimonas sp.]